ncbi:MAG: 23S rRNA (pseudouridine(1915)-N(3))-methyltransferase RlmH, partial [Acetobacteraceae bacterium]
MPALHVIAIGRLRDSPEAALVARYAARLRPPPALSELPEARGPAPEVKRREGAALLAALPPGAFAVA